MALLEVRNLQVNYGRIQAVKGIDLDVERGALVAPLGANGAGKACFFLVFFERDQKGGGGGGGRRDDHLTSGLLRYGKGVWLRSSG